MSKGNCYIDSQDIKTLTKKPHSDYVTNGNSSFKIKCDDGSNIEIPKTKHNEESLKRLGLI